MTTRLCDYTLQSVNASNQRHPDIHIYIEEDGGMSGGYGRVSQPPQQSIELHVLCAALLRLIQLSLSIFEHPVVTFHFPSSRSSDLFYTKMKYILYLLCAVCQHLAEPAAPTCGPAARATPFKYMQNTFSRLTIGQKWRRNLKAHC